MSLSTEIDRLLRHSFLARAQPWIRAQAPWLHAFLLKARDTLLPIQNPRGLRRHQHRAIERFLSFRPDLSGPVLELGTDVKGLCLRELAARGAARPVGLNLDVDPEPHRDRHQRPGERYEIVRADLRSLPFADASATSMLSITAFEHLLDFGAALEEFHRVLRPGGILFADVGPIWSCGIGHHALAKVDGVEVYHWKPGHNPVPHFAHLLQTPGELRPQLLEVDWVTPRVADAVLEWIYEGDGVNRLFYEDYLAAFEASPLEVVDVEPVRENVPAEVQAVLEERYPGKRQFDVRMFEVVLRRPAA
jgi:SAM-dependent methyltransferase